MAIVRKWAALLLQVLCSKALATYRDLAMPGSGIGEEVWDLMRCK